MQKLTGAGTRIFTRQELDARETAYWTTCISVGIIFGSGLLISFLVGIMIMYQIVATQVGRNCWQFAALKAIGYRDHALAATVSAMSLLIVIGAFIPEVARGIGVVLADPAKDTPAGDDG